MLALSSEDFAEWQEIEMALDKVRHLKKEVLKFYGLESALHAKNTFTPLLKRKPLVLAYGRPYEPNLGFFHCVSRPPAGRDG